MWPHRSNSAFKLIMKKNVFLYTFIGFVALVQLSASIPLPPAGWTNPTGLQNSMIVNASVVSTNGALLTASNSILIAQQGSSVIGFTTPQSGPGGSYYYPLQVFNNSNSVPYTYAFYNGSNGTVWNILTNAIFSINGQVGCLTNPVRLVIGSQIKAQTLTFNSINPVTYGVAPFKITASTSSGLAVTYASSVSNVASISSNIVTVLGAGSTTITASQIGNTNWLPALSVTQPLIVKKVPQTITFTAIGSKTFSNAPFTISATSTSKLAVTNFMSSTPSVATISGNMVTINGAGSSTITAVQIGNENTNSNSASQIMTVLKASQTIPFTNALTSPFVKNGTITFAQYASSGLTNSYTSSKTNVLSFSGYIGTMHTNGSAIVTVSQSGNTNYNPATTVQKTIIIK